ncbi:hypothetical protein ACPCIR_05310 [Mycobacterium sp. NPDC051198]
MAWNEIPARDDDNLSFQVYYARTNVIYNMLPPFSRAAFDKIWSSTDQPGPASARKATFLGLVMGDMIRGLGLREITECEIKVGEWFVHSGITNYSQGTGETRDAVIHLQSSTVSATVRRDCEITATAGAHMADIDDISLVVGRRLSESKFDLVAAGYRDPYTFIHGASRMSNLGGERTGTTDLARLAEDDPWTGQFLQLSIPEFSEEKMLLGTIGDTVERFRQAVERQGGWRLLYDDAGNALHETQHQGMFKIFSRLTFETFGITVDNGTDHGSGSTDFTLRHGNATAIVEFKKDTRPDKIRHGFEVQLPRYMRSAGAAVGFYIVMCHYKDPEDVKDILAGIKPPLPATNLVSLEVIDCRRQAPASKARSIFGT